MNGLAPQEEEEPIFWLRLGHCRRMEAAEESRLLIESNSGLQLLSRIIFKLTFKYSKYKPYLLLLVLLWRNWTWFLTWCCTGPEVVSCTWSLVGWGRCRGGRSTCTRGRGRWRASWSPGTRGRTQSEGIPSCRIGNPGMGVEDMQGERRNGWGSRHRSISGDDDLEVVLVTEMPRSTWSWGWLAATFSWVMEDGTWPRGRVRGRGEDLGCWVTSGGPGHRVEDPTRWGCPRSPAEPPRICPEQPRVFHTLQWRTFTQTTDLSSKTTSHPSW